MHWQKCQGSQTFSAAVFPLANVQVHVCSVVSLPHRRLLPWRWEREWWTAFSQIREIKSSGGKSLPLSHPLLTASLIKSASKGLNWCLQVRGQTHGLWILSEVICNLLTWIKPQIIKPHPPFPGRDADLSPFLLFHHSNLKSQRR